MLTGESGGFTDGHPWNSMGQEHAVKHNRLDYIEELATLEGRVSSSGWLCVVCKLGR